MKKTLLITTILGSLISSQAFAKTQGNYAGLDLINTNIKADYSINVDGTKDSYSSSSEGNKNQASVSANYKYAFNFNNFFVAPGLFADYSNVSINDTGGDKFKVDYRYGAKLDLGYDFTDKFAAYVNIGAANNRYTVNVAEDGKKISDNHFSPSYGIGAKYSVTDNLDLNAGYEMTKVDMKLQGYDPKQFTFKLNILRFGVSYKF